MGGRPRKTRPRGGEAEVLGGKGEDLGFPRPAARALSLYGPWEGPDPALWSLELGLDISPEGVCMCVLTPTSVHMYVQTINGNPSPKLSHCCWAALCW